MYILVEFEVLKSLFSKHAFESYSEKDMFRSNSVVVCVVSCIAGKTL